MDGFTDGASYYINKFNWISFCRGDRKILVEVVQALTSSFRLDGYSYNFFRSALTIKS